MLRDRDPIESTVLSSFIPKMAQTCDPIGSCFMAFAAQSFYNSYSA
jgi:hypothetical protein